MIPTILALTIAVPLLCWQQYHEIRRAWERRQAERRLRTLIK